VGLRVGLDAVKRKTLHRRESNTVLPVRNPSLYRNGGSVQLFSLDTIDRDGIIKFSSEISTTFLYFQCNIHLPISFYAKCRLHLTVLPIKLPAYCFSLF
jgi:hypothetical protein